ncbi:MFS transporter [Pseudomonas sp. NY15436]|uniref:MFS transporter n=1 Tax=Pseudomonas sp. NY15436 TaxID=3400359 RepID=UPI003A872194
MNRAAARRRLNLFWWLLLALALAPQHLMLALVGEAPGPESLATPVFVVGLLSMFLTLPLFRRYKHALIATGKARDGADEPAAWQALGAAQRRGALVGSIPAWIGALAVLVDLHGVPVLLLGFASLVILWLYRLPRQLA